MKCIHFDKPGGPEVLHLFERSIPEPAAHDVLIEVYAAGINRADIMQRKGFYPPPPGASDILGLEVAGKIIKCGEGVTRWKAGDTVCTLLTGGGYAEYAVSSEELCLSIPLGFSFEEAASLPEAVYTVWTNIFEDGNLQRGETIMIHGGSGGVGTTAILMARAFGTQVITTVGKKEAVSLCKRLGADKIILYNEEDFVIASKEFT